MDERLDKAKAWLHGYFSDGNFEVSLLSGDASFRRYFRVHRDQRTWALMDAPPEKEDSKPFSALAKCWRPQKINVPKITAEDLGQGFILLEDFGDTTFYSGLAASADPLYKKAIDSLLPIQFSAQPADYTIPPYDEKLLRFEISLFTDWLMGKKLQLSLSNAERQMMSSFFDSLVDSALEQPRQVVHRDYHSRNLMLQADGGIGIIDFQDAVIGPITYDLVSLLRDCYIKWPITDLQRWRDYYLDRLDTQRGLDFSRAQFNRWLDLMGLQRHLKAAGIFARLSLRDGKHGYLNDIPRTISYMIDVTGNYSEFSDVHHWLAQQFFPLIKDWGDSREVTPCVR